MRDHKYVMIRIEDRLYPVIFPQEFVHKDMARAIQRALHEQPEFRRCWIEVESAGFVSGLTIHKAFGESESLGIQSHPDDTGRIQNDMLRHFSQGDKLMEQEQKARDETSVVPILPSALKSGDRASSRIITA